MPAPSPPSGWNLLTAAATALSVQLYKKMHAEAENPKDFPPPARTEEEGRKEEKAAAIQSLKNQQGKARREISQAAR